jgi:hypothetical protein
MGILTAQRTTDPRPDPRDRERSAYLRSFLFLRLLIGANGTLLPFTLILVSHPVLGDEPFVRGSLSAYYYSGVRDLFVGSLCATALFLIAYKVVERNLDNTMSTVAGLAAIGVALFPTGRPEGTSLALTPLQNLLGEKTVQGIHFGCAFAFIGALAAISYFFGLREGNRPRRRPGYTALPPRFWRTFHWSCAGLIVASVAFLAVTKLAGGMHHAMLYTEIVSTLAFGASWAAKGLELPVLLGRSRPADLAETAAAS